MSKTKSVADWVLQYPSKIVIHNKRQKIARYLFRYEPCQVVFLASLVICLFLMQSNYFISVSLMMLNYKRFRFDLENVAYDKINFTKDWHRHFCLYDEAWYGNVTVVDFCKNYNDSSHAVIFIEQKVLPHSPVACADKVSMVPCFEILKTAYIPPKRSVTKTCLNTNDVRTTNWTMEELIQRRAVPTITNEDIENLYNITVLAHQLVVTCPVCYKRYKDVRLDEGQCYSILYKHAPGFPNEYNSCGRPTPSENSAFQESMENKTLCTLIE
ncbi:unnamed protein product [Bursaphelenchus okinawaensis]|uniref:Uncharacterized protein n=1 Tax=Bursaphelenchus okinawaensis TaxID=465554 RepID=A0A811KXZ6_9BILA|nr:unnamed protein product [Bursaphelenchus okinawaensis]CAG9112846.1 unnamed protein product [Bursaphelenchus okinawaensis]